MEFKVFKLICFSYFNPETLEYVVKRYKGQESLYVDNVIVLGNDGKGGMNKITITFRIPVWK